MVGGGGPRRELAHVPDRVGIGVRREVLEEQCPPDEGAHAENRDAQAADQQRRRGLGQEPGACKRRAEGDSGEREILPGLELELVQPGLGPFDLPRVHRFQLRRAAWTPDP